MTHESDNNNELGDLEFWPRTETNHEWGERYKSLTFIHKALKDGWKMHAFLSGGGLRVVSLTNKNGDENGYGESPYIEDALVLADIDFENGGQDYKEVYGVDYPHFLTGKINPSGGLDAWVRQGRTFDAWAKKNRIYVQLNGYEHLEHPKDLADRVIKTGIPAPFRTKRGFVYNMTRCQFANGEFGTSTSVLRDVKGKDPFFYKIKKTGRGKTFLEAVQFALQASSEEI